MGKILLKQQLKTVEVDGEKKRVWLLDNGEFDSFDANLLSLGDMSLPSEEVESLAAVFDLSGFTKFCSQIDPHLLLPEFLNSFLGWLFDEIKKEFVEKTHDGGKELRADLPFMAKFTGDGVLFLWDTRKMDNTQICNAVVCLKNICYSYTNEFYPGIKKVVDNPPTALRCGIARGKLFSVGNAEDYVGPCINLASRLQRVSLLTFCFPRKGFDIEKDMGKDAKTVYTEKRFSIRGIGENILVWVVKEEFDKLPEEEKKSFGEP